MARGQLILDRYEPLGTAGSGGFGTVQIAWDSRIQRKVAIKTIRLSETDARRATLPGAFSPTADRWHGVQPWNEFLREDAAAADDDGHGPDGAEGEYGPDDEPVTSLAHLPGLDEARTAAKLQDPRIVGVFDFEVRGQIAYLIMEYVEGITLTRLLVDYEEYLTLDVVAAVFDAVAGALTTAHKAGVLHLDIKPDNILINARGQAKVTDFGLATLADAAGTGLAGGGTIGYMPLEQMRRQPLDARTDEWSLASVLYEMLTGDNPFRAPSLEDAQQAIEDAELVLPSLCWERIDNQIDDVIFYALDPDPDQRYATVAGFAEEVDKFLGDPKAGERQLAAIVGDAIGLDDEEDEGAEDDWEDDEGQGDGDGGRFARRSNSRRGFPKPDWDSSRIAYGVARASVAVACAVATGLSLMNLPFFVSAVGAGTAPGVALACAVGVALVAAALPHVGVVVAGILAGFCFVVAGKIVVGAAIALAVLIWCYAYLRLAANDKRPLLMAVITAALVAAVIAAHMLLR